MKTVLALLVTVSVLRLEAQQAFQHEELSVPVFGGGALYGTLTIPVGVQKMPLLFLHAGSGPTDRDGNSQLLPGKNNSLLRVAERLAQAGIAVFRPDKRMVGKSSKSGPASEADLRFSDYVRDVQLWAGVLQQRKEVAGIVFAGHSEGALIVAKAVNNIPNAKGYISLCGAGVRADSLIAGQLQKQLPPAMLADARAILDSLASGIQVQKYPPMLASLFRPSVQPYLISWFAVSPTEELRRMNIPILIIQGLSDIQVPNEQAEILAAAVPNATVVRIQDMNHVLAMSGDDMGKQQKSYSSEEIPLSNELMSALIKFMKACIID